MPGDHVVLLAGFDFMSLWSRARFAISFEQMCLNRLSVLIRRGGARDPRRVTLFDVRAGQVRYLERGGKTETWRLVRQLEPIRAELYRYEGINRAWVIDKQHSSHRDALSITHLYQYLTAIGERDPGSIAELSIFSHGSSIGPRLLNSSDDLPDDTRRDPSDHDGRRYKDFDPQNLALPAFQRAFGEGSFIWFWACAAAHAPIDVIRQLLRNRRFQRQSAAGTLDSSAAFPFRFTQKKADEYFWIDPFFPQKGPDGQAALRFERSVASVVAFLRGRMESTYSQKIARASGSPCFGALPGTWVRFERESPWLFRVPVGEDLVRSSDGKRVKDYGPIVDFYRRVVGVQTDPEGRGYMKYQPDRAASIERAA
jgi:hypothetical protein